MIVIIDYLCWHRRVFHAVFLCESHHEVLLHMWRVQPHVEHVPCNLDEVSKHNLAVVINVQCRLDALPVVWCNCVANVVQGLQK